VNPPVFTIAAASAAVLALLGTAPTRCWPFGIAPRPGEPGYALPYAVFQTVYGTPENTLSCAPEVDLFGVQIDAYAKTASEARAVASALRDAFEAAQNHVTGYNGEDREPDTGLYRVSFTAEFWTPRTGS
jgi:hypothetical protein